LFECGSSKLGRLAKNVNAGNEKVKDFPGSAILLAVNGWMVVLLYGYVVWLYGYMVV
jgi:hypothetical protein